MKYKIYPDSIKLFSCYQIPKARYHRELVAIRNLHPSCPLWQNRSENALRREWASHALAYSLGVMRERTADCDLNFELKWYANLAYFVAGTVALLVIK